MSHLRVIRSAVSGKTTYLVAGFEMEDGRPITEGSKYRAAIDKNVKIINEDRLLQMIRSSNPKGSSKSESVQKESSSSKESSALANEEAIMKNHKPASASRLLTIRYAPSSLSEIIGNKSVIENLFLWLKEWEDVHIHSTFPRTLITEKPPSFSGTSKIPGLAPHFSADPPGSARLRAPTSWRRSWAST